VPLRGGNGGTWGQRLQPYIKSTQLFQCPSNTVNTRDQWDQTSTLPNIKASYAANMRIVRQDEGFALSAIQSTSQKIIVSEVSNQANGMAWPDWGTNANWLGEGFAGHLGTMNCLFADGHVKAMRPTATMTNINMWGAFSGQAYNTPGCPTPDEWNQAAVNCDDISTGALQKGLGPLEKKYQ